MKRCGGGGTRDDQGLGWSKGRCGGVRAVRAEVEVETVAGREGKMTDEARKCG
jgi:hypothetical protein